MAYCKRFFVLFIVFLLLFFTFNTSFGYTNSFTEFDLTDYYEYQLNQFRERFYMLCVMGKFENNDYSTLSQIVQDAPYIYFAPSNTLCFYNLDDYGNASEGTSTVNDYYSDVHGKMNVRMKGRLRLYYSSPESSYITAEYNVNGVDRKFIPFSCKSFHYLSVLDKGLLYLYQKEHPDTPYEQSLSDIQYQLGMILQTNSNIQNNTSEIEQSVKDTGNFLKDETTSDSDFSMSGVTDSTPNNDSILGNYFSSFVDIFTRDNKPHTINISVPFTNRSFTIDDRATYYFLSGGSDNIQNSAGAVIYVIIQAFWYFLLGYFIFKDIQGLIDKFSSGNFGGTSTNIKADML